MSRYIKYFAIGPSCEQASCRCDLLPEGAKKVSVCADGGSVPGAMYSCAGWIVRDFKAEGLVRHASDELHIFIGGDAENHESLNAEVDFQIENDHLVFSETSFVFVPAGTAHGFASVSGMTRPFFHHVVHVGSGFYKEEPAEAAAPAGMYLKNRVVKYDPVDGRIPEAPEGFLTFLLWIDSAKLKGAPYTERSGSTPQRYGTRNPYP
jgi:hypothetical protein